MILRFTDGTDCISFNTVYEVWNDSADDSIKFIEVSHAALCEIAGELNFNQFSYSDDLHHEPEKPDPDESEIPLF